MMSILRPEARSIHSSPGSQKRLSISTRSAKSPAIARRAWMGISASAYTYRSISESASASPAPSDPASAMAVTCGKTENARQLTPREDLLDALTSGPPAGRKRRMSYPVYCKERKAFLQSPNHQPPPPSHGERSSPGARPFASEVFDLKPTSPPARSSYDGAIIGIQTL